MWSMTPESMDVNENGAYTLGLRVPQPPLFRLLSTIKPSNVVRWLLPLDAESLKSRAEAMTGGLKDYGDFLDMDAFMMAVADVDNRGHLWGRMNYWTRAPMVLAIHLRLTQTLREHPEIRQQKIDRPIIVAGYVRSGTTWLQHLLAETYGDKLRYTPFWESLGGGIDVLGPGFMKKMAGICMWTMRQYPSIFAMHEVNDINQPEEELGWSWLTGRGMMSTFENDIPELDKLIVDPSSAKIRYGMIKAIMQVKQWEEGPRRWLLKSPEHLLGVQELAEAFPDAKVITIHRDEVSVFKSLLMLQHMTRSMSIPDESKSTDREVDAATLQLCAQQRGLLADMPSANVESKALQFRDVIGQPIHTLKEVVAFADLPWNAAREATAQAAVAAQSLRKKKMGGKITYDMEAFGLTEDKIRERLSRCDRYEALELKAQPAVEEALEVDTAAAEVLPGKLMVCNATLSSKANLSSTLQTASSENSSFHAVTFTPAHKAAVLVNASFQIMGSMPEESKDQTPFNLTPNATPPTASIVDLLAGIALADTKHFVAQGFW